MYNIIISIITQLKLLNIFVMVSSDLIICILYIRVKSVNVQCLHAAALRRVGIEYQSIDYKTLIFERDKLFVLNCFSFGMIIMALGGKRPTLIQCKVQSEPISLKSRKSN